MNWLISYYNTTGDQLCLQLQPMVDSRG